MRTIRSRRGLWLACAAAALLALWGCATMDPEAAPPPEPEVEVAEPETVRGLLYRRLAWTEDMRSRVWIDEVFVPDLDVAFNLRTDHDTASGDLEFRPALNAFVAHAPVMFSHDLYGRDPVEPQTTEIAVPADLARRIRAQAELLDTLHACQRVLGTDVDRTELLPAVVGSPRWRPKGQEE